MTHKSATPKYKIESTWTPPKGFLGAVIFRATIVQSKNVFWTTQDSPPFSISLHKIPPQLLEVTKQSDTSASPSTQGTRAPLSSSGINYDVCRKKFCFGLPNDCIEYRSCNFLLAGGYSGVDGVVEYESFSVANRKRNQYFSMALSSDNRMGE